MDGRTDCKAIRKISDWIVFESSIAVHLVEVCSITDQTASIVVQVFQLEAKLD